MFEILSIGSNMLYNAVPWEMGALLNPISLNNNRGKRGEGAKSIGQKGL